jgi:hypothetical protein
MFLGQTLLQALTPPVKGERVLRQTWFIGWKSMLVIALTGTFTEMAVALQGLAIALRSFVPVGATPQGAFESAGFQANYYFFEPSRFRPQPNECLPYCYCKRCNAFREIWKVGATIA